MIKTAIVALPRLEPHRPPPGPAIIANVCNSLGHAVTAYDLNIKFYHYCREKNTDYFSFDRIWDRIVPVQGMQKELIHDFVDQWCDKIVEQNFDYVLLSVFGISGIVFTEIFLEKLRPSTKAVIIAGGMGVASVNLIDKEQCFGQELKNKSLIDMYITGEGERVLIDALNGKTGPGINNNQSHQIEDLDDLPIPDYGFFDLDEYEYIEPGKKDVYITGSRGCVRKCTYCDVHRYWPKYRYRSGESITTEIISNYERFGITRFYFTDSLVNGSLKAFVDMCNKLSAYKFDQPISWSGQFIFRTKNTIPADHFAMISAAGGRQFYVGIETGSDRVRFEMGKKFTNEDIDFQLEECHRHGIKIMPLMFTGYITETLDDHRQNLDCFRRWQKYVANGTINGIELGANLIILPGAPVENMIESHGLQFMLDSKQTPAMHLWQAAANPELTIQERIRRKIEVHETAIRYAWPVWRQQSRLQELKNLIITNRLHEPDSHRFYAIKNNQNDVKKVILIESVSQ